VKQGIKRLQKQRSKATQGRVDNYFKVLPKDPAAMKRKADTLKEKRAAEKKAKADKKKK
jgi:hypothetical protein